MPLKERSFHITNWNDFYFLFSVWCFIVNFKHKIQYKTGIIPILWGLVTHLTHHHIMTEVSLPSQQHPAHCCSNGGIRCWSWFLMSSPRCPGRSWEQRLCPFSQHKPLLHPNNAECSRRTCSLSCNWNLTENNASLFYHLMRTWNWTLDNPQSVREEVFLSGFYSYRWTRGLLGFELVIKDFFP